ncbi:hypothetical protein SAMN05421810_107233 [Amycolatopsis arida]|uniref:Uncharacterized protein n=1 Tax=Amycolatopsis arida TaxID=587909 RepID=A0A1I5YLM9_9PSEU|nr:hypothetical protein [Amycolatopsis arida]TDX90586.1 hypothetical protein CLV69_107233 [Amycolatopsis arida]SFQ44797.1 hypothetical protein SAMN05421810_107233 [Amycolatopsis arida]
MNPRQPRAYADYASDLSGDAGTIRIAMYEGPRPAVRMGPRDDDVLLGLLDHASAEALR